MSYAAAIYQLNAMVPELYQSSGHPRRKFSLHEIRILLDRLGDPHLRFPAVLIAGTNGKGSTAATLASILTAAGLSTGLYTSPHLARVNERIRLNREEITDDSFARLYFQVHEAAQQLVAEGALPQMPSFFEILTAQAFLFFAEARVEIAVIEVGMGGRLDATNIVDPLLSVITDISLDHTEWLGSTISAITREKAGILRPNGVLVTLPQHPEANQVLGEVAAELGVRGVSATPYMPPLGVEPGTPYEIEAMGAPILVDSPLAGAHQHRNIALALASAVELNQHHRFPIPPTAITQGIRQTRWPGRLERMEIPAQDSTGRQEWILDVAHNPAGAWALRAGLNVTLASAPHPHILIFSCLRDKPITEMAQILFPLFDHIILAPIHAARAADMQSLLDAAEAVGTPATPVDSVRQALDLAARQANGAPIVVSGSVYLVGEARSLLLQPAKGAQP